MNQDKILCPQNGLEKLQMQNTEFHHKETKEAAYENKYYENQNLNQYLNKK